jgi:hypothetical protein
MHIQQRHGALTFTRQRHHSWNALFWCLSLHNIGVIIRMAASAASLMRISEMLVGYPTH